METLEGLVVTYLGDWVFYQGPTFTESPFETMAKDCHLDFLGTPLTEALVRNGATVKLHSNWELYHLPPDAYQAMLAETDVLIVSDIEARCFQLSPRFFDRATYGTQVITFPDRLKTLLRRVDEGMGALFLGGWLSFTGYLGKGGWRRSSIANALPWECLPEEDLQESSEGYHIRIHESLHPVLQGLPLATWPPIMGYNEVRPRERLHELLSIDETGDVLLGVAHQGTGRLGLFTSDPAPHWGINFVLWEGYGDFWTGLVRWAARRSG